MPTTRELIDSLRSKTCPACGGPKGERKTVCRGCFGKLDSSARDALYRPLGDGYAEAVDRAMRLLGADRFLMPLATDHQVKSGLETMLDELDALEPDRLTEWEIKFISDMVDRSGRFSFKQRNTIEVLHAKYIR